MGVRIISGAIGSGKSRMCLDEIDITHGRNPSARCVMIVPDHYSYETEKRFVERFGGTGLNNIEVLTLRRMAINTLTLSELNHLTDAGRQMLIYKAVNECCDELYEVEGTDKRLLSSMKRRGFLDVAASLISEMKRYMVTPEILAEKADEITDNAPLKNKLTAFSLLYEKYAEYVAKSGASDGNDDLRVLARHIEEEDGYDENTYVWIDRFDKFMPQQAAVIEAILKKGAHVTISVCCPENGSETEREIYAETLPTLKAAYRLADIYGFEGSHGAGKALSHLLSKPDLYTLLSRWNEEYEYDTAPPNIRLFRARDTYSETERAACEICDIVRTEGARYRDIAVMCGDENDYIYLIEAIFSEYGIPYFTDRKIILSDHPIAMQILSLFRVIRENWSYESVMSYLRAGFIYKKVGRGVFPLDQNEIDELENFILKYGIRGAKRWLSEDKWYYESDIVGTAFGEDSSEENETADWIDALRREIAAPAAKFADAVKGKHDVTEIASVLFEYLGDINLYSGLKFEISRFKRNGMVNEAEQFTKIWNLILDVLNQTAQALSGDKLTAAEYEEYMSVGLSKCEIRAIPSGIDQVYVGSAERMSSANVKYILVLGAKNGTFPTGVTTEGFFSDRDRNTLAEQFDIRIAPDTRRKTDEQYFKVYRALCAVSKKLYVSYSVQDEEGKPLGASHMYIDIKRKFPKLKEEDNLTENGSEYVYISSPKATMHHLITSLASGANRGKVWDAVYDWYKDKDEWRRSLSVIDRADYYERHGILLREDIANLLYSGHIEYSPTRLNTFSMCPFGYFMRYGLGAKEREEWAISPMSMGTYAHRVIHDFCAEVEKDAQSDGEKIDAWRALTDSERDSLIDSIIDDTCAKIIASDARDKEKTRSIFRRMGKTIRSSAALVQKCLASGDYAERGMEKEFCVKLTDGASLKGTIDRVDACDTGDGKTCLRVVDYKTGSTEFDVVNIANGYNMQMVIYALAMHEEMKNTDTEITGVYYTAVRDEYTKLNKSKREDNIKEMNRNSLRLDGVTFADEDADRRMKTLLSIDRDIAEKGASGFAGIKTDKDGKLTGVRTPDEINGLMESVRETVNDTDKRTRSGDIGLNPYSDKNGETMCRYCDYAPVCKFDEKKRVIREKKGGSAEVWERMKTKGAAMRGVKTDDELDG